MRFTKLLFGTAGTPIASKERGSLASQPVLRKMGLDCMELEFVRGVKMKPELARQVKKAAEENKIVLTVHGPYYINLNSQEKAKVKDSIKRIMDSAIIGNMAGAFSCTFHAAYFMKMDKEKVYNIVKKHLKEIVSKLKQKKNKIWIRPETTGKESQFGSLQEIIKLSQELDQVLPCIDFAHLHARTGGKMNSYDEWHKALYDMEKKLGKVSLNNMHIHMSGIAYSKKGERHHLNLPQSDLKYRVLMKVLKEFNVKGVVISESPNIEGDALLLQKIYKKL